MLSASSLAVVAAELQVRAFVFAVRDRCFEKAWLSEGQRADGTQVATL